MGLISVVKQYSVESIPLHVFQQKHLQRSGVHRPRPFPTSAAESKNTYIPDSVTLSPILDPPAQMNRSVRLKTMRLPLYASLLCLICCLIHTSKFFDFNLTNYVLLGIFAHLRRNSFSFHLDDVWSKPIYFSSFNNIILDKFGPCGFKLLWQYRMQGNGGWWGGLNYLQNVGHISLLCSQRMLTVDSTSYFSQKLTVEVHQSLGLF